MTLLDRGAPVGRGKSLSTVCARNGPVEKPARSMSIARHWIWSLVVVCVLGVASQARAGIYWNPYWGLDARLVLQPVTTTIPTGYYNSWYYPQLNPYLGRWGLGWGAPFYYYGFRDRLTYTYFRPRVIYAWSRYWDPEQVGYTLDMYTFGDDANGDLIPFDPAIANDLNVGSHTFLINGAPDGSDGADSGVFTPFTLVAANAAAIGSYLSSLGLPAADVNDILDDQMVLNVIANNPGNGLVGFQLAGPYAIPEPGTFMLIGIAGLLLLPSRRKRFRSHT